MENLPAQSLGSLPLFSCAAEVFSLHTSTALRPASDAIDLERGAPNEKPRDPNASLLAEPNASLVTEPNVSSVAEPNVSRAPEPNVSRVAEPNASRVVEPNLVAQQDYQVEDRSAR